MVKIGLEPTRIFSPFHLVPVVYRTSITEMGLDFRGSLDRLWFADVSGKKASLL